MALRAFPAADRRRFPELACHHCSISPDHSKIIHSTGDLYSWPDGSWGTPIATLQPITMPYLTSMNHSSWLSSNAWFLMDDVGETTTPLTAPYVDNFSIFQCFVDGHCRHLLETQSAQDYN